MSSKTWKKKESCQKCESTKNAKEVKMGFFGKGGINVFVWKNKETVLTSRCRYLCDIRSICSGNSLSSHRSGYVGEACFPTPERFRCGTTAITERTLYHRLNSLKNLLHKTLDTLLKYRFYCKALFTGNV